MAGCGKGNLHWQLQAALLQAQQDHGVAVRRSTGGSVVGAAAQPQAGTLASTELSAVNARVEVMLGLMAAPG